MYSTTPTIIYGFHGTDKEVALNILNRKVDFELSNNNYDWLGTGIYFWENNVERARQYAEEAQNRKGSTINAPFALGSVIELGNCLDLLNQKNNDYLFAAYSALLQDLAAIGKTLPDNLPFGPRDFDFKARERDCAVIRYACTITEEAGRAFDSVRAPFLEGDPLYEGAMFRRQNHIQIAVINTDCIKGIFLPRDMPICADD